MLKCIIFNLFLVYAAACVIKEKNERSITYIFRSNQQHWLLFDSEEFQPIIVINDEKSTNPSIVNDCSLEPSS